MKASAQSRVPTSHTSFLQAREDRTEGNTEARRLRILSDMPEKPSQDLNGDGRARWPLCRPMELGVSASHHASPVLERSQEILEGRCQPPEIRHRPTWSSRLCQAKSTASTTRSVALPSLALRFMLLLSSGQSRMFNLMRYVRRYTPHTAVDATWGPRAMTDAGLCCVVTAGPAPRRLPTKKLAKVKVNVSRSADEVTASGRQREKGQMALFKASRIPKHRQVRLIAKPAGLSDETDLHDPIPAMHGV
ncbi:hypothetical protein ACCO45_000236 [Purpureocillium lilacinum]|uniref:Uncharacterized protein n=1 Tax=Purpureocillium lilacinum TaxID=33203 RepID=A0ACC4E3N9_PURLI